MTMTRSTEQANGAIKIAAMVVAGVYLYRRFTEGTAEELKASEKITPLGRWLVGWGVVFFSLSVAAGPFPGAAGDLAILLMVGSLLTNGIQISKDLNKGLGTAPAKGGKATAPRRAPSAETTEPTKSPFEVRSA